MIEELFSEHDVHEITSIPLPRRSGLDCRIWSPTKNGVYAEKSGYKIVMKMLANDEDLQVPGDWSKLWKIHVPPRAKTFIWRALRDCLPIRLNLQRRGVFGSFFMCARNVAHRDPVMPTVVVSHCRWLKPVAPALKCNLDAALLLQLNSTGLYIVLRDAQGVFVACRTLVCPGLRNVIFESDAKIVVDAMPSSSVDNSEFGSVIASCRTLFEDDDFCLCSARQQANKVVRGLARAAYSYASPSVWNVLPKFVTPLVTDDCVGNE
ncbi:hypothetical protein PTKIN_Ptkin01aG0153100 [Pterospermum kingtungense]